MAMRAFRSLECSGWGRVDILLDKNHQPWVLEVSGLDVTPGMSRRFDAVGDDRMVEILAIILRDEVGHVEAGSRWYHY